MKKLICLLIIFSMLIPTGISAFAANEVEWPYILNTAMPFKPADNYVSLNNPPAFSWPLISDTATYDLRICEDEEMTVEYKKVTGLERNVYNFGVMFDVEKKYYWQVRFNDGGKTSVWTEPREFIIDSNAVDFTMPEFTEDYIKSAMITTHPRLLTNKKEDLEKLQEMTDKTHPYIMSKLETNVSNALARGIPTNEKLKEMWEKGEYGGNGKNYYMYAVDVANIALMYLITQEEEYLTEVEKYFEAMQHWNEGDEDERWIYFNSLTDTTEPYFINSLAYAYDWLYNDMSEDARKAGVKAIENHLRNWYENYADGKTRANMRSLYAKPDASHQWRVRQLSLGALAIYEDSQVAQDIITHILPLYAHALPMTRDDGSFDNNPFYYTSSGPQDFEFSQSLYTASDGKIDVRNNVAFQSRDYYLTYQWPVGGFMSILGDQNRQTAAGATTYTVAIQGIVASDAYNETQRGINAWMMKKNGVSKDDYLQGDFVQTVIWNDNEDVEYIAPTMLENSKLFNDSGIASLFSDVADDNKIAMIFRSSEHGSLGHMHPDNNSFFIQALGENLAIDSDYYDAYLSPFDLNWNRKTYAHNSITYDIGEGQPKDDLSAKGHITSFATHANFDIVGGDATQAYKGGLGKYQRDIIYVRPDTYIVIDDLKSRADKESEFEWWINANGNIKVYESGKGLQISKNEAALDVKVAYPENIEAFYSEGFVGPDGISAGLPTKNWTPDNESRVYFKTEKTDSTKIVTYMNVHKVRNGQAYVKETVIGNVLKLEFEDGTISYVKLDNSESVTVDGYTFFGTALTVKGDSYLVVDETNLSYNGKTLFEAGMPVSCAFGDSEVSFSSMDNETYAKIYLPKTEKMTLIRDEERLPLNFDEYKYTLKAEKDGDYVTFNLYYGTYHIYLNDKPLPGAEIDVNVNMIIDGEPIQKIVKGTINGNQVYAEFLPEDKDASYTIVKSDGLSGKLTNPGMLVTANADSPIVLNKKNVTMELKRVSQITVAREEDENHDKYETLVGETYLSAVDYSMIVGNASKVYWDKRGDAAIPSQYVELNDYTLQSLNNRGDLVVWTLNVPESGYYDVVMSCSTLSGQAAARLLTIGNVAFRGRFQTEIFSDLDSYRFKTKVYLEKGTADLTLYVNEGGQMIYDWVGLVPSDK